jgi:hypothetical protein
MAPPLAADDAAKARIMSHMNKDHARSLSLYVQHHSNVSSYSARNPDLVDLSFSELKILAIAPFFASNPGPRLHTIPISPPLKSWAEARGKVVAMDKEARRALGVSEIDLSQSKYVPPTAPFHVLIFAAVVWFYFSMLMQVLGVFSPDTPILSYWPFGGAEGYLWLQKMIAIPTLVLHVVEAAWLAGKLQRFGVGQTNDIGVWWAWISSCFIEGWGAHQRFGDLVRKAERDSERKAKESGH